jgi:RNA polymerase-binding transcription factor DksA
MASKKGTKLESKRLGNQESDWNLVGGNVVATRTRGGGKRKERPEPESSSTSDEEWEEESDSDEAKQDELYERSLLWKKPTHQRVILEVAHVEQAFERFSRCPECGSDLSIELRTVCITSSILVTCKNVECEFVGFSGSPCAKTTMHEGDNYERMSDYALNVLYVLGFVSMGDGHSEAGRILGLCGLPNDTTMDSRSFHMIEDRVVPTSDSFATT